MDQKIKVNFHPKVLQRQGTVAIFISGLWARRIGDYIEFLAENPKTGEWVLIMKESIDSQFSHIYEPSGIDEKFTESNSV